VSALEAGWADALTLRDIPEGATMTVRVQPDANRTVIRGVQRGALKLMVSNVECMMFLSNLLHVSPARVKIVRGQFARDKFIQVSGLRADELRALLTAGA